MNEPGFVDTTEGLGPRPPDAATPEATTNGTGPADHAGAAVGAFGALREQLVDAAAAFAEGPDALAGILAGIVDDVDRALAEPLEIFPVCHHSPSSALAMVRRLAEKRPSVIYLEMCEDLRPLLGELRNCRLPVALQAYAPEPGDFPPEWGALSVVAPITEASAEYQAISYALDTPGVELVLVDRSADHLFQWLPREPANTDPDTTPDPDADPANGPGPGGGPAPAGPRGAGSGGPGGTAPGARPGGSGDAGPAGGAGSGTGPTGGAGSGTGPTGGAGSGTGPAGGGTDPGEGAGLHGDAVGVEIGDLRPRFAELEAHLLHHGKVRHWSEWWDQYVEQPLTGADYQTYRQVMVLVGSLFRRLAPSGRVADRLAGDEERERFMWARMREHLAATGTDPGRCLYVCGAFHAASRVEQFGSAPDVPGYEIAPRTATRWLYGLIPSSHSAIEAQFGLAPGSVSIAGATWTKALARHGLTPLKLAGRAGASARGGRAGARSGGTGARAGRGRAGTPQAEAPDTDTGTGGPQAGTPGTDTDTGGPQAGTPDTDTDTGGPQAGTPNTGTGEAPDTGWPDRGGPGADWPDRGGPDAGAGVVDRLSGFLSRPPVLDGLDEDELLGWCVDIVRLARRNGYLASTADAIAVFETSILLAGMRNRGRPTPYDFQDAAVTCIEKDVVPGRRDVRKLCEILLGGDRIGQVGYDSLPPLARDVYDRLAPLGADLDKRTIRRVLLDLSAQPELRPCADLLWTLRRLLPEGAVRPIMGQRRLGERSIQESWDLALGRYQRSIIELGYEGVTVEQVLEQRLRRAVWEPQATAADALAAVEDALLYLDNRRFTNELGARAVELLAAERTVDDAPEVLRRIRRLLAHFRATEPALPAWCEEFVRAGYAHYCTLLPTAFVDDDTGLRQVAAMLGFLLTLEGVALALGCDRAQLELAVRQSHPEAPAKVALLWATRTQLGLLTVAELRARCAELLANPLVIPAFPAYLSGFVQALEPAPGLASFVVELMSNAFAGLPDRVLLPWLPKLITTLRDQAPELVPVLVREAGRTFPASLPELDGWVPPWSAPAPGRPEQAPPAPAGGPAADLLAAYPVGCDAVAGLLGHGVG